MIRAAPNPIDTKTPAATLLCLRIRGGRVPLSWKYWVAAKATKSADPLARRARTTKSFHGYLVPPH